jgi:hypothetical protein
MDYFTDTLRATVAARRSYYNSSSVSPIVVQVVSTPLSCAATGGPQTLATCRDSLVSPLERLRCHAMIVRV